MTGKYTIFIPCMTMTRITINEHIMYLSLIMLAYFTSNECDFNVYYIILLSYITAMVWHIANGRLSKPFVWKKTGQI